MKITFYSNYLNHHQLPFCEALYEKYGEDFHFVACTPFNSLRKSLGYRDMNHEYPFVVRAYENTEQCSLALSLAAESDIVIHGSAPYIFLKNRLEETDKITFVCSERIMRKGRWHAVSPKARKSIFNRYGRYKNKPLYLLCSGAFVRMDYILLGAFYNKTFKWGYFPETKHYDIDRLVGQKEPFSILWVGRFLKLKHPEKALKVAKSLKKDGFNFKLSFIGNGPLEDELKSLSQEYGLQSNVEFLGSMSPEKVREHMEKSQIFLFTSDKGEGWGAVLNEAMNSGCAVIADKHIGAAPFLIEDGKNGFLYSGCVLELYKKTKFLLENADISSNLGKNAYKTITEEWNAQKAAERIILLAEHLINLKETPYKTGPCSKN